MTQQDYEEKLNYIEQMIREDHAMISSMHRTQRLTNLIRIMYWTVLIGGFLGAYYWVYPYIDTAKDWYSKFSGQVKQTQKSLNETRDALKEIQNTKTEIENSGKSVIDGIKNLQQQ